MEPESGSDLASVRTRANQVDGGWEITGTKVWTSVPTTLTLSLCWRARNRWILRHRHDGLSQFIVDLDSPGIEIRPIKLLTGHHHFNEVVLDRVFVPDELVLGAPGDGWEQVTRSCRSNAAGLSGSCRPSARAGLCRVAARGAPTSEVVDADLERLGRIAARAATLRQPPWQSLAPSPRGGSGPTGRAGEGPGTQFEREVIDEVMAGPGSSWTPHRRTSWRACPPRR